MRILVVATSAKHADAEREIRQGQRPRIDYLELCNHLNASYEDYNTIGLKHGHARLLEEKLRLDFYLAMRAAWIVRTRGYDIVLSMSERVGIPLSYLLPREVKHVVVMHHPESPPKRRLLTALRTAGRWDRIVALSHAEARSLRESLQLEPNRVQVLHTPLDTTFYRPIHADRLAREPDHLLSIGLAQRDYPTLIQALRTLPHVTCHISATSAWASHKAGYEGEIIPDNVRITSYDHPGIIRERYAMSRFTIIPIRHQTTQWSAGSTSVLQPQAIGRPVIATRKPGLADYVLDGETGLLVEGGNPAAMAAAIDYLWKNPEKAAAMGRRGHEWVIANFSLERWLDSISNMLYTLTTQPALSAA